MPQLQVSRGDQRRASTGATAKRAAPQICVNAGRMANSATQNVIPVLAAIISNFK